MPGILISDGLYDWFKKWHGTSVHERGADYEDFKNHLAKHLLEILFETVPQIKGKVEYWTLGTPMTEVSYLSSYHAASYGTRCDTQIFQPKNDRWTTTPHTRIPGLHMAGEFLLNPIFPLSLCTQSFHYSASGSDAFLPAVCGAMYGGILGAVSVIGYVGTMKFVFAFLSEFADSLQEENPKLGRIEAYLQAMKKFGSEPVAN